MKQFLVLASAVMISGVASAQLMINTTDVPVTIDFTGFAGAGFQPGGGPGMLDSDLWSATGFSDGDVDFGATATTGDFAKGTTMGLVTSGGIYGVDIAGNQGLMVQPTADDFTPGSFILKIENNTGVDVTELGVAYTLYVLNDAGRSNSYNFSISYDNITYSPITGLDYASPEAMDFTPYVEYKSTTVSGLTFTDGSILYLRWTGDDISGTGSRDEFALDDIALTAIAGAPTPLVTFDPAGASATEDAGSVNPNIQISESVDCSVLVSISAGGTADVTDVTFTEFTVDWVAGDPVDYTFILPIVDDLATEDDETLILELSYVSGGCAVGLPASYTLLITDNDVPPPPDYTVFDIGEVTTVDLNGVNPSNGTLAELTGVVHGINTWDGGLQFTLIDATGGISVFSYDNTFAYTVTEGDAITVQGTISQFNGLSEIEPDTLWFIDGGNPLQTATVVTALNEDTESQIVKLTGLVYEDFTQWLGDGSSFNVTLTDGVNDYIIRIDDNTTLSTLTAPMLGGAFTVDITGIGSQYDTDMPYLDGYQLMPRYLEDITLNAVLSVPEIADTQLQVYPNPTTGQITIMHPAAQGMVMIRDVTGKVVLSTMLTADQLQVDVQSWAPGLYFVQLDGVSAGEFIKQ